MATFMPPWFDWLDYIGADSIGRLIGLWFRFCVSLPRGLVGLVIGDGQLRPEASWLGRVGKMAISTLVTVGCGWRSPGNRFGLSLVQGDRILTDSL
jgi:hypothetical protein